MHRTVVLVLSGGASTQKKPPDRFGSTGLRRLDGRRPLLYSRFVVEADVRELGVLLGIARGLAGKIARATAIQIGTVLVGGAGRRPAKKGREA